ncbi:hypothetical protein [Scytonema sp. PCC 10023]|uniref:hypothetical protein n=1 Tax=Scytonema sp. PCC 10023 TaxID=1680591 RepID=UPI0039C6E973
MLKTPKYSDDHYRTEPLFYAVIHQALRWIAQPCNRDERLSCESPDAAQLLIIAVSGLLVADVAQQVA